jgi:hypothetical protein
MHACSSLVDQWVWARFSDLRQQAWRLPTGMAVKKRAFSTIFSHNNQIDLSFSRPRLWTVDAAKQNQPRKIMSYYILGVLWSPPPLSCSIDSKLARILMIDHLQGRLDVICKNQGIKGKNCISKHISSLFCFVLRGVSSKTLRSGNGKVKLYGSHRGALLSIWQSHTKERKRKEK